MNLLISIIITIMLLIDFKYNVIAQVVGKYKLYRLNELELDKMIIDLHLNHSQPSFFISRIRFMLVVSIVGLIFVNDFKDMIFLSLILYGAYKYQYVVLRKKYLQSIAYSEKEIAQWLKKLLVLLYSKTVSWSLLLSYEDAPEIIKPALDQLLFRLRNGQDSQSSFQEFATHFKDIHNLQSIMRMLSRINGKGDKEKSAQVLSVAVEIGHLSAKVRNDQYLKEIKRMSLYGYISLFSFGALIFIFLIAQIMYLNIGI